jgi:hypothetical protein
LPCNLSVSSCGQRFQKDRVNPRLLLGLTNGPLFTAHFVRKSPDGVFQKTPSKPPKLLDLTGPCNAKASTYTASSRACGRTSLPPL